MTTTRNKRGQIGGKWIRPERRLAIYLRDSFTCVYCFRDLRFTPANQRSLDHVVPVTKGGSNLSSNLVTCCKLCNDRKGNLDLATFAERLQPKKAHYVIERVETFTAQTVPLATAKQIIAGNLDQYSEVNK